MKPNRYPGKCAHCGQPVAPHEGLLVRVSGKMVPAHKNCVVPYHKNFVPDPIDTMYEDNCRDACGL